MVKKIYVFILLLAFLSIPAYSYIDPGTGSYLIQILIAAFLGASVGIRLFWNRIKEFFSGKKSTNNDLTDDTAESTGSDEMNPNPNKDIKDDPNA